MRSTLMIAVLIASLAWTGTATSSNNSEGALVSYHGSTALPDETAFRLWLGMVNSLRDDHPEIAERMVAKALGIDMSTSDGALDVAARTADFGDMRAEMNLERYAAITPILCAKDLPLKSSDEIIDTLNSLEAVKRLVVTEYLNLTFDSLESKERETFENFLHEFKKQVSHTETDSGEVYRKNPERDIRADLELHCSEAIKASTRARE